MAVRKVPVVDRAAEGTKRRSVMPQAASAAPSWEPVRAAPPGGGLSLMLADVASFEDEGRSSRRRWCSALVASIIIAALAIVGAYLIIFGMQPREVAEMPLPETTYDLPVEEAVALAPERQEELADSPYADFCNDMGAEEVCIPAIGASATAPAESGFDDTEYGIVGLRIPPDPRDAVHYGEGGAMWGGTEGTTLLAAHVAWSYTKGAFYYISELEPGDAIWTTDAEGRRQAWAVAEIFYTEHEAFPQEYFSAEGVRRLVLTTCGGTLENGFYSQNVYTVAYPVELPGSTPVPVETPQSGVQSGDAAPRS